MRYRSRETPGLPITNKVTSGNGTVVTSSYGLTQKVLLETMTDDVVPNFHKLVAAGVVLNNVMLKTKDTLLVSDKYVATSTSIENKPQNNSKSEWDNLMSYFLSMGSINLPTKPADTVMASLRVSASVDCLANVNKTTFDAGTFAGEWSKTKRLHLDICKGIKKLFEGRFAPSSVRDRVGRVPLFDANGNPVLTRSGKPVYRYTHREVVRRGDSVADAAGDASNLYLVGRYGIAPLLHDLEDAAKFVWGRKQHARETARGNATQQHISPVVATTFPDTYGAHTVYAQRTTTLTKRFGILYEPGALSGVAQLGFSRPLSTAWELVPWSFAFDWLFKVGRWLDAVQPDLAFSKLCAWESTLQTEMLLLSVNSHLMGSDTHNAFDAVWTGSYERETTTKSRLPWNMELPKFPPLGDGLSALRAVDAATLMLQSVRRRL